MKTLKRIYNNIQPGRKKVMNYKTRKIIPWYKISSGGKCPDKDSKTSLLFDSYWNHFGCSPYDFIADRESNGENAGQCVIERMAEAKKLLSKNVKIDADHIYPIKLAYELGRTCLKNTLKYNLFNEIIQKQYKDLIKEHPDVHNLFQTQLGVGEFPLEIYSKDIQTLIESKLKTELSRTNIHPKDENHKSKQSSNISIINNPIIYTNKNNVKYSNRSNNTKKNKNILHHI
jgi:hypothetical protein